MLGLIARGENRGLGLMCWEVYRHLQPDKVLVIDMGPRSPFQNHFDRFPYAQVVKLEDLDEGVMSGFLDGLDTLYTAETPYNYGLYDLAREKGVRTICHAMFEFYRHLAEPDLPRPDEVWAPSTWHLDAFGPGVPHVAVPVDRERCAFRLRTEAKTFLHIAGHRAMADRNGTQILLDALPLVQESVKVIIATQSPIARARRTARKVELELIHADRENYWSIYDLADVLVAPRRYGGLSLPIQEAMSCGLPIISLDVKPQNGFLPEQGLIPAKQQRRLAVQPGEITCYTADDPADLAAKIDELARTPVLVELLSGASNVEAAKLSWRVWEKRYRERLNHPVSVGL